MRLSSIMSSYNVGAADCGITTSEHREDVCSQSNVFHIYCTLQCDTQQKYLTATTKTLFCGGVSFSECDTVARSSTITRDSSHDADESWNCVLTSPDKS